MTRAPGARRIPVGAEVALAFASGAVSFALVAVILAATDSDLIAVLLGAVALAGVLAIARFVGPAYAIPVAIAALVAYDWFQFPPTHPNAFPDRDNLLSLLAYLAVGTFAGELASYATRRSEVADAAWTELADEQAALRRVATIVAGEASQAEVFSAIAQEVARLFRADEFWMLRFQDEQSALIVASSREHDVLPVGSRQQLGGNNVASLVFESGRPARLDDVSAASGPIGERARSIGVQCAVGAPIVVGGGVWGVIVAGATREKRLPAGTESRLGHFTELLATAIANAESHAKAAGLADEQAALRRVATLVATEAAPAELFAKVAQEAADLLGVDCALLRDDGDRKASVVAASGPGVSAAFPVGSQMTLEGDGLAQRVIGEGRPQRIDDYSVESGPVTEGARARGISSSVGCPIVVRGRTWGAITVATFTGDAPAPPETASRLAQFAELVATAIANVEARSEVAQLVDEQAALRRVATLVAEGVDPAALFDAVTKEVARVFADVEPSLVPSIIRFDPGPEFVLVGTSKPQYKLPLGSRWGPKELYVSTRVLRSGGSARVDEADLDALGGPDAELLRSQGFLYQVGSPIVVEGLPWGAMTMNSGAPLPPDTGQRLEKFTDLIATAIANSDSREGLRQLADEQAALRRIATLVARRIGPEPVFVAVAEEVATIFGTGLAAIVRFEPGGKATVMGAHGGPHLPGARVEPEPDYVVAAVRGTGRAARFDVDDRTAGQPPGLVPELGIRSAVASPIVVDGELWGAITTASVDRMLPPATERRLADLTELLATAISNAHARSEVERLAQEQAALRRVATLVARDAPQTEVFAAIAEECAQLFGTEDIGMVRYDGDSQVVVASAGRFTEAFPHGTRAALEGDNVSSRVFRTGRPARVDDYRRATGAIADSARSVGIRCAVGVPIEIEGRIWGAMITGTSGEEPLPPETERRVGQFTDLVATAVSNAAARAEVEELAEEQAALRRVAELVAREAPQAEVFAKVTEELGHLVGDADCSLFRDDGDGSATIVGISGKALSAGLRVGTRLPLDGTGVIATVMREGRPRRMEDNPDPSGAIAEVGRQLGIRSAVGWPVLVRGRVWGAIGAGRYEPAAFPPDTETRMARFAELVATAIGNAEARAEVERLAQEQASLRRVATLVAEGGTPTAVFAAVAEEVAALLGADHVVVCRYERGAQLTVLAHSAWAGQDVPVGARISHVGDSVEALVHRTAGSARVETSEGARGPIAEVLRAADVRVKVGAPIIVEGRLWGVISAGWKSEAPPPETEERMTKFAELLDTAIANADTRDQLTASRVRLLTEADDARRRVVRDLHDGAQQRLVHSIITLKLARRALRREDGRDAIPLVDEALEQAEQGNNELRELAHGLLPSGLLRGGLRAGVDSVVARLDLPVLVEIPPDRFPREIEASAYFIVAEALTNVVKHARARHADVRASVDDGVLQLEIRDDGVGRADPTGHGLVGLRDRATALGGRLAIESPAGGGTRLVATLPLHAAAARQAGD